MDIKDKYEELTAKLKEVLPFSALPTRGLVQELRTKGSSITLKTELTVIDVYNTGDVTGILCTTDDALACALTHITVSPKHPLFKEIKNYQKKRFKRIEQLNRIGRAWN